MKAAELRAEHEGKVYGDDARPMVADDVVGVKPLEGIQHRAVNLVAPVITMVVSIVVGIYVTGRLNVGEEAVLWDIIKASSGSTAVLWAVIMSLVVLAALNLFRGLPLNTFVDLIFKGMGGMIPVVSLLLLAFALGDAVRQLGTGVYVAGVISGVLSTKMAVIGLFLISCFVAFSTGTSWGTFAVMVPIAVPMAATLEGSTSMFLAAVLGGGVFGDHCSPISDTTIISSMASASDHIDHVRTQIPYASVGAAVTVVLYLIIA
jgi:Na+/H+ antiporter NhaC